MSDARHDLSEALSRAAAHAPFLARQANRFGPVHEALSEGDLSAALSLADKAGDEADGIARQLRLRRGALALVTGVADLAGAWDLEQVTQSLSDLADRSLDEAIVAAFAERFPDEPVRGFAVIALGKHGSRELNYSSDIDPILLFDPYSIPHGPRETPQESAIKLARRVVELLNARDADGYVFRVDLRLRPSPEATPIILPVEAAIGYYETTALGWEQAAFIRARAAAGDKRLGEYFLQAIRPFVWRRSLDFGAVRGIADISQRIRSHYAQGQSFGPGYDMKRGRGGIREIEFFAQVHQLIHGGRRPELRAPATRDALRVLAEGGIIEGDVAQRLDAAYQLFRTIEHRLQMVEDRQTHELPRNGEALDNVAHLHGLDDGAGLIELLAPHVDFVGSNYDRLTGPEDGGAAKGLPHEPGSLNARLVEMGFVESDVAVARITHWRDGSIRALRSAPAREALEELLPGLMEAMAQAPDPVSALNRLDNMIGGLPSAINFFRLLAARPALMQLLAAILSHAPAMAEALGRRAELFEALIDTSALEPMPDVDVLAREIGALEAGDDYQVLLDRVRQRVGERRFALGTQIISGASDPLDAARGYSRVAEAALQALGEATVRAFEETHGRVPGAELVILALGRLGGGLLTHASDLDLVYLFDGDFESESDGPKPLGATQYFIRLSQRVTNALSVPTASGPLYEVDTRLRPSGAQGLPCVSFASFERYQREEAWTWEHLALTRARPVFGSGEARARISGLIETVLQTPRDTAVLARDAVRMRREMARHKPPAGVLDVKLMPGGLVDLEFLVHVNQFRHGMGFVPELGAAIGELVQAGHIAPDLHAAHDLMTRYLVVSRLVSPKATEPAAASRPLVARICGAEGWEELVEGLARARAAVESAWTAIVDEYGEQS